jgi:hypothetical protein
MSKITQDVSDSILQRYQELKKEAEALSAKTGLKVKKTQIYKLIAEEFELGMTTIREHSVYRERDGKPKTERTNHRSSTLVIQGSTEIRSEAEIEEITGNIVSVKGKKEEKTPIVPEVIQMPSTEYFVKNKKKTYIITSFEMRVGVSEPFLRCLETLANHLDAEMLLTPVWIPDTDFVPQVLRNSFEVATDNIRFNSNLILHYCQTHALSGSVVSGWRGAFDESAIIPGLQKELVTLPAAHIGRQILSTGSVGYLNATYDQYAEFSPSSNKSLHKRWNKVTSRSAGRTTALAQKYVCPSALIVEIIDDKTFLTRFVTMENEGVIYDLDKKITPGKIEHSNPIALITGDYHCYQMDQQSHQATKEMISFFNPGEVVVQDFWDSASANRYEIGSSVKYSSAPSLQEEKDVTIGVLNELRSLRSPVTYLQSNHCRHLQDVLEMPESSWRYNGNYADFCELQAYRLKTGNPPIIKLLELDKMDDVKFVSEKDFYKPKGSNTLIIHGHNSYKAQSWATFVIPFGRVITGHFHSPQIKRNALCVGTNAIRDMSYSIGASACMGANAVLQPDDSAQLLNIIDGKWKA